MLDSMTGAAAFADNARLDALATNQLGACLLFSISSTRAIAPSTSRALYFSTRRAREFYADWERAARDSVAILRSEAGRNPFDRGLSDLVGELSTQSEEFRGHWAAHDVRLHNKGEKAFNHPVVGELELSYDRIDLPGRPRPGDRRLHRRARIEIR